MFSLQEVGIIEISNTLDYDFPSQINSSSAKEVNTVLSKSIRVFIIFEFIMINIIIVSE
jgi:hypothetical protein